MKTIQLLKTTGMVLAILTLVACVNPIPEGALNVTVHKQYSTQLDSCKKHGYLDATQSWSRAMWGSNGRYGAATEAEYKVRSKAYLVWGADTISLINRDVYKDHRGKSVVKVHAIAYTCFGKVSQ